MSHTNELVVYCITDEGINLSTAHDNIMSCFDGWDEREALFGHVSDKSITSEASASAILYPPREPDGMYLHPRDKGAVREPAPFLVSKHVLKVISESAPDPVTLAFFLGPNVFAAFDVDAYYAAGEDSMQGADEAESTVEDIATDADGIADLVYEVMMRAACYPNTDCMSCDYMQLEDKNAILVAFYGD